MTMGLVCDACDALSPINATVCQLCGASLGVRQEGCRHGAQSRSRRSRSAPRPRRKVCAFCGDDIAPGHRFCGNCGKPVSAGSAGRLAGAVATPGRPGGPAGGPKPGAKTMFFGAMQAPSPKLILIKGEGMDGVTYVLSSTEHIAGRLEGAILFPEDPLLSPRHANFIYRDGQAHRARRGLGQRRLLAHHQAAGGLVRRHVPRR